MLADKLPSSLQLLVLQKLSCSSAICFDVPYHAYDNAAHIKSLMQTSLSFSQSFVGEQMEGLHVILQSVGLPEA